MRALLAERSFQHIDLDPYGSPAPFLDLAFANLGRRAGVSFTATDAAALCGASPRACERRYGAKPTRTEELCHEAALRILLAHAVREAAKHDQAAHPVLAHSREHYFRCYVETRRSAQQADALLKRIEWLVECDACFHRGFAPERERVCPACGAPAKASGPMWSGPLFDAALLQAMTKAAEGRTLARAQAVGRELAIWQEEAATGGLPYASHRLAEHAQLAEIAPLEGLLAALRAQGHGAARCHLDGRSLRTPAPARDVLAACKAAAERPWPSP